MLNSRRLHGRRGLKSFLYLMCLLYTLSPPSRAAWIEIPRGCLYVHQGQRRRLHGRRGLKYALKACNLVAVRRRLHGRRGLKCVVIVCFGFPTSSPPSRAAWIEIPLSAIISAMYRHCIHKWYGLKRFPLCDLPSLGIFINQKQGYCILDAATLFSEKTVIGEQRYSVDNVYRLSHIAMFVKSFPLKTAGNVLPNRCPENCRQSKYDRLGSRAQLLSRKKSEFDNGFAEAALSSHIIK